MVKNNSLANRIADAIIYATLLISGLVALVPFMHVVIGAVADPADIVKGNLLYVPSKLNFDALRYIFSTASFNRCMLNSVIITLIGTFVSMLMTVIFAYPLSQRCVVGRNLVMTMVVFTMVFHPGMIPNYMNIKDLGLLDNYAALFLPTAIVAYNMILVKNYFQSMAPEIRESAIIDGANDMIILFRIALPLAKPVLATVALFYAVDYWNAYLPAILYISDSDKWPLQVVLRNIVIMANTDVGGGDGSAFAAAIAPQSLQYATILVATLPILCLYPFLQKYFTKGIMMGSVKG